MPLHVWNPDDDITDENRERIEAHRARLLTEVRAHRLAEARKARGLTQAQVAESMGVSKARVGAIENGRFDATVLSTVARYVEALGGSIEVVAHFGDERLVIGG